MARLPQRRPAATAIAGGRVALRMPVERDRAEYVKLREVSEAHLRPWEPWTPDGDLIDPGDSFDRLLTTCDTPESRRFLIIENETGAIAGQISLNQIFRGPFQNAILGYWIGAPFAGRGLMTEAIRLVLGHAFGPMGLHRVEANIMPHNAASRAVVQKIGFRYEGTAQRYLQIAGAWADHEHWALTAEEWPAAPPRRKADRKVGKRR